MRVIRLGGREGGRHRVAFFELWAELAGCTFMVERDCLYLIDWTLRVWWSDGMLGPIAGPSRTYILERSAVYVSGRVFKPLAASPPDPSTVKNVSAASA